MPKKPVLVCAGVILRSGAVLLARRAPGRRHAGQWEFPGGRVEPGETPADALRRELREELGIEAEVGAELARNVHAYEDGPVELVALLVGRFSGTPTLKDHDALKWAPARDVPSFDLVPADVPIAAAVAAHRRRGRYTGTHPKSFAEKYKEHRLDPEAVEKAKARGSTPAGAHLPVMLPEVLDALAPLGGAVALDCTLGWGGHAAELARRAGRVIALDKDAAELARTAERLRDAGTPVEAFHCDYAAARGVLDRLALAGVDALLADLGVSSMQLDRPERGFSFKNDGPLDMRMDRTRGVTAYEWLKGASAARIADALRRFGDEPDAEAVAAALAGLAAAGRLPKTTRTLAAAVAAAKGLAPASLRKKDAGAFHPAARTFQALRVAVNSERDSLAALLRGLPWLLKPGGRAALLTFHSGEESLVREAWSEQTAAGLWREADSEGRRPTPEEVRSNPRSRSARLWRAVRA